jgi:hypothetical protein
LLSQTTQIPQTVDFAGLEVAEISTVPSDADLDYAWRGDAYGLSASELPQDLYTMSPEFEMVGTGRDTGLQANYDFLQSNDPLMQSVLNSTMIDSISLDGSYLANMPAMTHESGMSYEERNSLDPEAYHFTAEIPKGGDNFNQLYSKFIGVHAVDAAEYYVDQHVKTGNPLWAIPGSLALLATPENAGKTALVLGGAGVASSFMTAYRAAGVLGVAEEGALITAETASGIPLVRRWDFDAPSNPLANVADEPVLLLTHQNPTTRSLAEVRRLRGEQRWQAGEQYVQELYGSAGQRHFPVPTQGGAQAVTGTGGRFVDAPVDLPNGGILANEVKTYQQWRTVNGSPTQNEVPLSTHIEQQIHKDIWLRDNTPDFDPRWIFLDAPPSRELSNYLTDKNIIHIIHGQ